MGGMEDFMTLVRVYFQAALASQLGITNLAMLPDLRVFKATMRVPTVNNKLGVGEKTHVKKMMKDIYGTDDSFFKEIDRSIHGNCRKMQDINVYLVQFQGFLYTMTEKTVGDIFNKNDYRDAGVMKTVLQIRKYNMRLGFSQKWVTDFVYQVVMLAKKEPRPAEEESEKKK